MPGVLTTGFVRKTETECFGEIIDEGRATISPTLDDSVDTVHGQQAAIVASKEAELWEVAEDVYNSYSANSEGDALDRACTLTGVIREGATYSQVTALVTVAAGATAGVGTVIATVTDEPDSRFVSDESVTNPGGAPAQFNVHMVADTTGPVRAAAGTLVNLENPPAGVTAITNTVDADLGRDQESDADLRVRRKQEMKATGATIVGATKARLLTVANVIDARVYTNRSDDPDADGRPGHCIEALVLGGDDDDIAAALWKTVAGGIESYGVGGTTGDLIDEEGNTQTLAFSRPAAHRVYIRLTGTKDAATYAGDAAVQETIADFSDGTLILTASNGNVIRGDVEMGGTLYRSKFAAAGLSVAGVIGISTVEFSDNGIAWTNADKVLGVREYLGVLSVLGIQTNDVTVVIT